MKKIMVALLGIMICKLGYAQYPSNACVGKVTHVGLYNDGKLTVSNGYGVHYICNVNSETNGVSATVCKNWHAVALAAFASGKDLAEFYGTGFTSCSALGNWVVPNPTPYFINIGAGS